MPKEKSKRRHYSLNKDGSIKGAIDSNSFAIFDEATRQFIVKDDAVCLPTNRPTPNENEAEDDVLIIDSEKEENCESPTIIFKNANFQVGLPRMERKSDAELLITEATLRVKRSQYLLDFNKGIGALRRQEAEINVQIAKQKLLLSDKKLEYKRKKAQLHDKYSNNF